MQTPDALEKLTAVTDAQKRDALKKLIDKHTEENTVSKKAARDTLIREGIYDRHGKLRVEFGGTAEKKTAAA